LPLALNTTYKLVTIENTEFTRIYYKCGTNFKLTNVTGFISPTVFNLNCNDVMTIEMNNSTLEHLDVDTPIKIIGRNNLIKHINCNSAIYLDEFEQSTIGELNHIALNSGNEQWKNLHINVVNNMKLYPFSSLLMGPNVTVDNVSSELLLCS